MKRFSEDGDSKEFQGNPKLNSAGGAFLRLQKTLHNVYASLRGGTVP